MRETVIKVWCDPCHGDDEIFTEADGTVTLSLGGVPSTLDMCERHRKTLIDPLADLLTTHGRTPAMAPHDLVPAQRVASGKGNGPGRIALEPWTCPLCSQITKRGSAIKHVYGHHHPPGAAYLSRVPLQCPECDAPPFARGQGAMAHRITTHGYQPLIEALNGATR
jgi:hypothetical protein